MKLCLADTVNRLVSSTIRLDARGQLRRLDPDSKSALTLWSHISGKNTCGTQNV